MRWHCSRNTHKDNSRVFPLSFLVLLLVLLTGTRAQDDSTSTDDSQDICAMTEVLKAMRDLLVMLSGEIKDLREQVGLNCMSVNATMGTDPEVGNGNSSPSCDASMKTNEDRGATDDGGDADTDMKGNR